MGGSMMTWGRTFWTGKHSLEGMAQLRVTLDKLPNLSEPLALSIWRRTKDRPRLTHFTEQVGGRSGKGRGRRQWQRVAVTRQSQRDAHRASEGGRDERTFIAKMVCPLPNANLAASWESSLPAPAPVFVQLTQAPWGCLASCWGPSWEARGSGHSPAGRGTWWGQSIDRPERGCPRLGHAKLRPHHCGLRVQHWPSVLLNVRESPLLSSWGNLGGPEDK